jgi:drug/metabolite transporter (DMT)-like permease
VFVKLTSMSGPVVTFWRVIFGIPILALATLLQRQRLKDGPVVACLGAGILFGLTIVLYFTAMRLTAIANVTLIGALTPALVAVVSSRTVGERVGARKASGVVVATAGVALAVISSEGLPGTSGVGDLAAAASLVFFVAYFLASKQLRQKTANSRYNLLMTVGAAIPVSLIAVLFSDPFGGYSIHDYWMVAVIAIFPGSMGHWLVNWAHTKITAGTSATIQLGVPIVAIAAAWLFVGESISRMGIVGSAIALGGIFFVIRTEATQASDERRLEDSEAIA